MTLAIFSEEQHGVQEKKLRNHFVDDDPEESDETPSSKFTRRNVPHHQDNSAQLAQKRKARSASRDRGVEACVHSFKIHPIQEPETVKEFVRVLLYLFVLIADN
jgi:hypothetical protein